MNLANTVKILTELQEWWLAIHFPPPLDLFFIRGEITWWSFLELCIQLWETNRPSARYGQPPRQHILQIQKKTKHESEKKLKTPSSSSEEIPIQTQRRSTHNPNSNQMSKITTSRKKIQKTTEKRNSNIESSFHPWICQKGNNLIHVRTKTYHQDWIDCLQKKNRNNENSYLITFYQWSCREQRGRGSWRRRGYL